MTTSTRRRRLGLLLLVVVLVATGWWWFARRSPGAAAPSGVATTAPTTGAAAEELRSQAAEQTAASDAAVTERSELPQQATEPVYQLRGTVLAEQDVPLTGVRVFAYPGESFDRPLSMSSLLSGSGASLNSMQDPRSAEQLRLQLGSRFQQAEVQADGSFSFDELRTRHLRLLIDHRYYALAQPQIVHLRAGVAGYVTLAPRLGGHIIGRIQGPSGGLGGEVRMTTEMDLMGMMQHPEHFMGNMVHAFSNLAEAAADGRFEFRAVAPSSNIHLQFAGGGRAARFGPTSIQAGQTREVVVHTTACGELAVVVAGPEGKPIEGARVRVQPAEIRGQQHRAYSTRGVNTATDGRGVLRDLLPGSYEVGISATGFLGADRRVEVTSGATARLALRLSMGGSVRGTVRNAEGEPIADAGVSYVRSINVPMIGDVAEFTGEDLLARAAQHSRTRSDAEGQFVLAGIEDTKTFSVAAWHADFSGGRAKNVKLGDQQVKITLLRQAQVVGRVVDDAGGEPVQEFSVATLVRLAMVMERSTSSQRIHASEDGSFALQQVVPGKSTLSIQADGFANLRRSIRAAPGQVLDLGELRLQRAAVVRGVVVDRDGLPVVGATVRPKAVGFLDNPFLRAMSGGVSCTTDASGQFELRGVREGRLRLKATANGHASGTSARLRIAAGQVVEDVRLQLGRGGSVQGELLLPSGMDPTGWLVTLSNNAGGSMQSGYVQSDGTFRFDAVDPGKYDIQGMHGETMTRMQDGKAAMLRPNQDLDIGKLMQAAQEQIIRSRCRVKDGETAEVTLDGTDLGEDGVAVTLRVMIGDRVLQRGWMEVERLASGDLTQAFLDKGRAKLSSVRPGAIRVQVRTGITMTPVGEPTVLEIPLATNHTATIRLPGGAIHGVVVDSVTGEPLSEAVVRIVSAGGSQTDQVEEIGFEMTDDRGEFRIEGLRDGKYSLFANDSFFQAAGTLQSGRLEGIHIESGREPRKVTLRTRRAARARVRVDDMAGRPQQHALVLAVDQSGKPLSTLPTRTNERGEATVLGLPTGELRLVVMARGLVPGFSAIRELSPARETMFRMTLEQGPRVSVRVESAGGKLLVGASMSARWDRGPWIPVSLIQHFDAKTGRVDLGHLAPGRVEFRVHRPGGAPFSVIRDIPAGPSVELVFTAPK